MVPEPLPTRYVPEVSDQATLAAAHSRQFYVFKARHHRERVRLSPSVNSPQGLAIKRLGQCRERWQLFDCWSLRWYGLTSTSSDRCLWWGHGRCFKRLPITSDLPQQSDVLGIGQKVLKRAKEEELCELEEAVRRGDLILSWDLDFWHATRRTFVLPQPVPCEAWRPSEYRFRARSPKPVDGSIRSRVVPAWNESEF